MTVAFHKVLESGLPFETACDGIVFSGQALRVDTTLVLCQGRLKGLSPHVCDRCAKPFELAIDETVEVYAHEGVYHDKEGEELLNVVEFFGTVIDFDLLCQSELEAYKSDYHYCGTCNDLDFKE